MSSIISDRTLKLRTIVLGALGAVLLWEIITRSLVAYLALVSPEAALKLRPTEPTALIKLADARLNPKLTSSETGGEPTAAQRLLKEPEQSRDDRLSAWAEIALKALADKLPRGPDTSDSVASQPALTSREQDQIAGMAKLALVEDPINPRALRILGQLAHAKGDDDKATKFMRAAVDRSLGESIAVYWMLQKSAETKDYAETLRYADILLRKRPQFIAYAMPMLAPLAESADEEAVGELEKALAANPPWRSAFFANLLVRISDVRTPLKLLLSVKATSNPPSTADLNGYLTFLISHKFYELAYYTWLQFLPDEQLAKVGLLANGNFEVTPSGLPFDWTLAAGSGVTVDIAPRPDAPTQHALFLELGPGRVEFPGVTQTLFLSPGTYQFKGKMKGEVRGRRGLQWHVGCSGNPLQLGESPMFIGQAQDWEDFDFSFVVPADKNCRAQQVRLALAARSASEQLVSGSIWYDELQISRAPDAAKDAAATPDAAKDAGVAPDAAKGQVAAPDVAPGQKVPPLRDGNVHAP